MGPTSAIAVTGAEPLISHGHSQSHGGYLWCGCQGGYIGLGNSLKKWSNCGTLKQLTQMAHEKVDQRSPQRFQLYFGLQKG